MNRLTASGKPLISVTIFLSLFLSYQENQQNLGQIKSLWKREMKRLSNLQALT